MNENFVSMKNWSDYDTSSSGRKNERWCMLSRGYSRAVKASSISSSLWKQRRDRSDGPSVMVETRGSVDLDIM